MKRPFWMHQLAEYILGFGFIAACVQAQKPAGVALCGALVLINAAIADGPMSAFRAVSRRLHRVLDFVVIAAIVVMSLTLGSLFDSSSRFIALGICAVLLVVAVNSNYAKKEPKVPISMEGGRSAEIGRMAGRATGNAVNMAKSVNRARKKQ